MLMMALATTISAQTELDEQAMIYRFKGIQFATKDTSFYINFRFRMQPRIGFQTLEANKFEIDKVDARIRRLRFRIDGFIVSRKLSYSIQLSFSRDDTDFDNTGFANIIRDAIVFYRPVKNLQIALGLNKLPGNRQRVTSSGQLQFADRSIVNSTFTLDRDFGIKVYYTAMLGKVGINLKGAVSTGDGRSVSFSDDGLAYTMRGELLPLGQFTNEGDYSEGDLDREPEPRMSIAGGYCYNKGALSTGGTLGKELYAQRDMGTVIIDGIFKYRGMALSAEYLSRTAKDPVTYNEDSTLTRVVYVGWGVNAQASYLFKNNLELAVRYSVISPSAAVATIERQTDVCELGLTRYINRHRIKAQLNMSYLIRGGAYSTDNPGNRWNALFQIEIGI